ncbi:UDP-glycosyltransferase UGT5-like [Ischnura elegans]|uniref:UDP-glycosyltransferase UGT5-like n=1 Tax=Ischnura elegans TaxID=197161 RepID=UPI001ED8BE63|nr:UDP-glycosyltransferase UGT5-like [Ischnura elegans]
MAGKIRGVAWAFAALFLILQVEVSHSANILALFPLASRSHNNVFSTITKALAQRGHTFTVVTSQPIDKPPPKYEQIDVYPLVSQHLNAFNVTAKMGAAEMFGSLSGMVNSVCRDIMQKEEVKALTKPKGGKGFDLIIMSNFFTECFYPFARVYKAPIVLLSPGGPMPSTYSAVGNVVLPSYYAETYIGYSDRMTLKERTINTLAKVAFSIFYRFWVQRNMETEMRAAFGEDTPSISELEEHVSLAVLNSHFSLTGAKQTVPSLIEAGGVHIKPPKELPADLKAYLDGAGKDGVIYFSMGSVLKSATLPTETRDQLLAAFSKVKQRVLWKWEGENPLPGQPKNVRLEKWLPQQDLLAHPNIKMFVTHGGLLSFQEATSRGVPLIGIPFFGDQEMNMNKVLQMELGVKVDAANITADNMLNAINEILGNPKYAQNMKKASAIMKDQKDEPLDRAIYWIEYVLRHDGAKHLKPAAFYLSWYQVYLLDVIFLAIILPNVLHTVAGIVVMRLIKKWWNSRGKKDASKNKTE